MNEDKNKVTAPYLYDTPTGIVQKEGLLFRGMGKHDPHRPVWVRTLAVFFSLLIFVIPGLVWIILAGASLPQEHTQLFILLLQIVIGILLCFAGVFVIYQNVRK